MKQRLAQAQLASSGSSGPASSGSTVPASSSSTGPASTSTRSQESSLKRSARGQVIEKRLRQKFLKNEVSAKDIVEDAVALTTADVDAGELHKATSLGRSCFGLSG